MTLDSGTARDATNRPECVLVSDDDGTVVWASPGSELVFGSRPTALSEDVTVGQILDLAVDETVPTDEDSMEHEVRVTGTDGTTYDVSVSATQLDHDGWTVYQCRRTDTDAVGLRRVLSRVSDGIVSLNTDWQCTFINDAAEDLIGRTRAELLGETIWEEFPSTADSRLRDAFEKAMETQEPVGIEWYGTETESWFEVRAYPSPTGLSVYFQDVTEREERAAELRRERDLNEQLLQVSPIGIAVHTPDGEFVRLNERAAEILDVDRADLLGEVLDESMWDATAPDGTGFPDEAFPLNVVLETGDQTFGTEMSLVRADGTRIWLSVSAAPLLDDDGEIARVIVIFDDVTEQKRYEQELLESEQLFRSVFEATLDALILADDEGTYHEVNQAACELLGRERDELVGITVADIAPPGYDVEAAWQAFLDQGELRGEFPVVRPDGETRVADFAATANVSPGRHLSALRDVTERKENQAQLEAQRDELERLNRINELIRDVNRVVVAATDRATIEEAVCDVLAQSEQFPVAATTRVDADGTVAVEHLSGLHRSGSASLLGNGDGALQSAIRTTADSLSPTVLTDLPTDEPDGSLVRELVERDGVTAVANIPIEYDGIVHGVLSVAAIDDAAFSDRELEVFVELGQILGAAIDAIQTKKLLYANAFLELELAVTAADAPLILANERVGGTWTLDGVVPVDDGQYLLYVDVGTADPAAVEAAAATIDSIDAIRALGEGVHNLYEVRVSRAAPITALLDAGGFVRGATFENGVGRFVVDITLDTDVRSYLERVGQAGVEVDLLAKREVERGPTGTGDGHETAALTDRQRTVLEAAFRSGYFDWPRRKTTGEELADSLGISSSTLHQHLRIASAKLIERYFSTDAPPSA